MSKRLCVVTTVSMFMLLIDSLPMKAAIPLRTDRHVSVNLLNSDSVVLSKKVVAKAGYDPNKAEQLVEAGRRGPLSVRTAALTVLSDQIGDQAIPALKEALGDPDLQARMYVARLLRLMGNTSGLTQMQKDYAALVPPAGLPDPNLTGLSGIELKRAREKMRRRDFAAMDVARILAEFEDHRGFELAAKLALDTTEQSVSVMRIQAARVLVEIAMDDPKVLRAENRDPGPTLVTMAESEKDSRVLKRLAGDVYGCRLRDDLASRVLEKIVASPHLLEKDRPEAVNYLKIVRERVAKKRPSEG